MKTYKAYFKYYYLFFIFLALSLTSQVDANAPNFEPTLQSITRPHEYLKSFLHFARSNHWSDEQINRAPTPVPVNVSVTNNNWVTTISICNTNNFPISLKVVEFNFHYTATMPSNIWGNPWTDWRLVAQNGDAVYLKGGTPWTPDLLPDPECTTPLTIQFTAPPLTTMPTGPWEFKTEGSTPPPLTGDLEVSLASAPAAGLPNAQLTVAGNGMSKSQTVAWGASWKLTGLQPAAYTISGAPITVGTTTYTADSVSANVTAGQTSQVTITYKGGSAPTGKVTVTLTNPPTATVPVTFAGQKATINQTVSNQTVLTLPADTYTVSSNVSGFIATPMPNPLVVPTDTALNIAYNPSGPGSGVRTVTMVNQCPFPVWFGFISGATPNKSGPSCGSDADCYIGSTCVDRGAGGKQCFWKTPVPANNNFQLAPNGGTNSITLPIYTSGGLNQIWSGAAAGRTNCSGAGCETADCGAGTGGCPAGRGFMQPATQAEFTFNMNDPDYYDVEFINGINIPVKMAPTGGLAQTGPYDCGSPGDVVAHPPMGACTWDMKPLLVEYHWVRAGGATCTSDANCTAPNKCGLSFNPGKNPLLQKSCGKLLGYWTANQICGVVHDYGAPFNCQMRLPPPQDDLTIADLLGCNKIGSCYSPGATTRCCGCADWDKLGVPVPPAPYTQQCVNKNPNWVQHIQSTLLWLKQACPSLYTYPFDDMSSTFTCRVMKDQGGRQVNSVDYTITFCPGGKTGGV